MAALAELELLEREPELDALRPVLDAAQEGTGRLVVVEGPPGIGKTRCSSRRARWRPTPGWTRCGAAAASSSASSRTARRASCSSRCWGGSTPPSGRSCWPAPPASPRRCSIHCAPGRTARSPPRTAYRLGALAEAEADARAARDAAQMFAGNLGDYWGPASLADVLLERGEVAEAAALFDRLPMSGDVDGSYFLHPAQMSRALVRLAQGRAAEAVADLLALGRSLDSVGIRSPSITQWRSRAATALMRAGDADQARALAEEEVELARRWGAPRALGMALRVHGLVLGGPAGLALLEDAAAVLEHSPARLERARALADLGAALRRAGRRVDAREPLRVAVELAQTCGATPLAETARSELIAAAPNRAARR